MCCGAALSACVAAVYRAELRPSRAPSQGLSGGSPQADLPCILKLLLDMLNMSLAHCAGHPDGSNPKMASRWQKDAKQLVNAAQRLVLVGAQGGQSVCGLCDHDCLMAGVSRHTPTCGLIGR